MAKTLNSPLKTKIMTGEVNSSGERIFTTEEVLLGLGALDIGSIFTHVWQKIYPVGAIYISTSSTNPSSLFGGTWSAFGSGRTLVGINASDSDFDTSQKIGGAKTHTLTVAQMPSHTHIQDSHNHTQNSHNHTQNAHTHTQAAHNHTGSTASAGAHTHTVSGTAASDGAHAHTASSSSAGSHTHSTQGWLSNQSGSNDRSVITRNRITKDPTDSTGVIRPAGEHTHTITVASGGAHTHTVSGTAASAGNHFHTVSVENTTALNQDTTATNNATTATNIATTATNQNTGGGESHNNLQPYIVVYMWRRTA